MAHDNNEIHGSDPCALVAEVPVALASVLLQKPQWLFSDRMYDALMLVLTDDQKEELEAMHVHARPIVFSGAVAVAR